MRTNNHILGVLFLSLYIFNANANNDYEKAVSHILELSRSKTTVPSPLPLGEKRYSWPFNLSVTFLSTKSEKINNGLKSKSIQFIGCGGILIGKKWALTALHCLTRDRAFLPNLSLIRVTPPNPLDFEPIEGWEEHKVKKVHYAYAPEPLLDHWNPQGNEDYLKDIALVELENPVDIDITFPMLTGLPDTAFPIEGLVIGKWGRGLDYMSCKLSGLRSDFIHGKCHVKDGISGSPALAVKDGVLHLLGITITQGFDGTSYFVDIGANSWIQKLVSE